MRGGGSGLHFSFSPGTISPYTIQASFFLLKGITFLYDISKSFNKPLKKKKKPHKMFFFF